MKKICITSILSILMFFMKAQFHHNIKIGGSNFIGLGVNTEYYIPLHKKVPFYIAPKLGLGHIFVWEHVMTMQFGVGGGFEFRKNHSFELGSTASYLFASPFRGRQQVDNFIMTDDVEGDYLLFSSFDYKIQVKKVRYTIGIGVLSYFWQNGPGFYEFAGDPIPMLKLGVGL